MLDSVKAMPGFSVDDLDAARDFYSGTLGMTVRDDPMGVLHLDLPGGGSALVYPKDDHAPATFTVLNLVVPDVGAAARALASAGVTLLRYPRFGEPDGDGVYRAAGGEAPDLAWFTDPAGNVLSVLSA